ncbi:hypothetical protein B0T25DRAFT_567897 [Lasiosphaeria hispida]|uniref:Uncharacterized protein n=1 Tax=Lasiosphaeria hispida TaxID=260671 RepID=A0AAJ0HH96_9PEZI|nr:hypothetical protein B0T25DRAFT_567897 [Lasiosphaeria hispida]
MTYVSLWENRGDDAITFAKKAYAFMKQAAPDIGITRLYQSDYAYILFQYGGRREAISEKKCGKDNLRIPEISLNVTIMNSLLLDLHSANTGKNISIWPKENMVHGRYYLS